MSLERAETRTATVALLKGATAAGDRVFPTRIMPLVKPTYPVILVYTLEEDMVLTDRAALSYEHALTLVIDARLRPGEAEDAEDDLDALCEAIVKRLLTSPQWVGRFSKVASVKTRILLDDKGKDPLVFALIGITVEFGSEWEPEIPDTLAAVGYGFDAIDPADPNLRRPGPDGRLEASGSFTIPTI